jgi:TRAP-type C4-dicarboxylate transport system permease large subunit
MAPAVLLGGMLSGHFTPTEAAAVACLYALSLGLFVYRTMEWKQIPGLLVDTAETMGLVAALVMVAGATPAVRLASLAPLPLCSDFSVILRNRCANTLETILPG